MLSEDEHIIKQGLSSTSTCHVVTFQMKFDETDLRIRTVYSETHQSEFEYSLSKSFSVQKNKRKNERMKERKKERKKE